MNIVWFSEDMSFKEIVRCLRAKKSQIMGLLALFSCFDIEREVEFKQNLKRQIYSLKFEEWHKDKIIEFIYGDVEFETLQKLIQKGE